MLVARLSLLVVCISLATGLVLLSPGYKEIWLKWDELIGKPLEETKHFLEVVFPGVELLVFKNEDAYTMPCFNQIKVLIDEDDIVTRTPEFLGEEPDFTPFGDLVGKSYIEVHDLIRDTVREKIVIKRQDTDESITSKGNSTSNFNYVLLIIGSDFTVSEPPRYIRMVSTGNDELSTTSDDLTTNSEGQQE